MFFYIKSFFYFFLFFLFWFSLRLYLILVLLIVFFFYSLGIVKKYHDDSQRFEVHLEDGRIKLFKAYNMAYTSDCPIELTLFCKLLRNPEESMLPEIDLLLKGKQFYEFFKLRCKGDWKFVYFHTLLCWSIEFYLKGTSKTPHCKK